MVTNKERREVAAKLRKLANAYVWLDVRLVADIFRSSIEENHEATELYCDTVSYVADLIEPEPERTCEWMQDEDGNWHTSCGEVFTVCNCESLEDNKIIYCHNCGAKVAE